MIGARLPAEVEIAPGLSADVSLQLKDATTITINPIASLHVPAMYQEVPLLGKVSPKINFDNEITVPIGNAGAASFEDYGALIRNHEEAIVNPARAAIRDNALQGAGVVTALNIGLLLHRRQRKHTISKAQDALAKARAEAEEHPVSNAVVTSIADAEQYITRLHPRSNVYTNRLRWTAAITGCSLLAGCAIDAIPVSKITGRQAAAPIPLDSKLAETLPILKDATISGIGGPLINAAAQKVSREIRRIDRFWLSARENYTKELERFRTEDGLAYLDDADIIPIFKVADVHCNQAYIQKLFGAQVRDFGARIILIAGDTYTTTNAMPYETNCLLNMLKQTAPDNQNGRQVVTVNATGNHDPAEIPLDLRNMQDTDKAGRTFNQLIPLDKKNNYQAVVEEVPLVSVPDPMRSGINGTIPEEHHEQQALLDGQGKTLADTACNILEETGKAPIAVGHRPESVLETVYRGCASSALSGHAHHTSEITAYLGENGRIVQERTLGSASGAPNDSRGDIGITHYALPRTPAVASVGLYSKSRNEEVGSLDIIISPDGSAQILTKQYPPKIITAATSPVFQKIAPTVTANGFPY